MAGNASANLVLGGYPYGVDQTQRSVVLEGYVLPTLTTASKLVRITAFSITSNVVTFTTDTNTLTTGGSDVITVWGAPAAYSYLNATFTTTSATATTIVAPLTHANVASTQTLALAALQGNYGTGGIPFGNILTPSGGTAIVAGIGPLQTTPKWIDAQTVAGSAFNYKVNLTTSPWKLLIFSGITQVTDATGITADTIAFRAEFIKDGF